MGLSDRDYTRDDDDHWRDSYSYGGQGQSGRVQSMTVILIIVNVAFYLVDRLLATNDPGWLMRGMAVHPDALLKPWLWWEFVSAMFAHDWTNNWHILGNMFTLYIFGRDVEGRLGPAEFLRFYLISGTIANIVFALLHIWVPDSPSALGASGAITAVVVLYICYFPHNILLVMFIIPMRAWVFGIIMIGMNMLGALGGRVGDTVQVAYDVHLSGAAIAFGYWHFRWNFGRIDPTQWLGGIQAWLTKPRLKIHKPSASEEELAAEADRILAKMHEQGESSLTARERKVLEDYSRQMRQKYR